MSKTRLRYVCQNCGTVLSRWEGRCPSCKEWDSLQEEVVSKSNKIISSPASRNTKKAIQLDQIKAPSLLRYSVDFDKELNRVLGGGIVPGSLVLIGGQPGIGKSTLLLQLACQMKANVYTSRGKKVNTK